MARLAGYGGNVYVSTLVAEDCEDTWDEQVIGNVTDVSDIVDYKVGNASARFDILLAFGVGLIGSEVLIGLGTLAAYTALWCWAKSTVNTVAVDDYRIEFDNVALCGAPQAEFSLPILTANVWKFCFLPLVAGTWGAANLPISIGLERMANDPGADVSVWLDHIVAGTEVVAIREWSIDVVAGVVDSSGFSDGQDKVFTVTQKEWSGSFSGFKDGAPLAIGTPIAIELMEAEVALPGPSTAAWRGQATITNLRPASSIDGVVQYSYDFQGSYALEWPTT